MPRYLDKVTEVAFHPTLRFHVRILYFDKEILDENFAEYEVWKAEFDTGDSETRLARKHTVRIWTVLTANAHMLSTTSSRPRALVALIW